MAQNPVGQTVITGQVIDSAGVPVAGVPVAAAVTGMTWWMLPEPYLPFAQGQTDGQGNFQLVGRSVAWPEDVSLSVFAYEPGYAIACREFFLPTSKYDQPGQTRDRYNAVLRLEVEEPVAGRVTDADGNPVVGAAIGLRGYWRDADGEQSRSARYPAGQEFARPAAVVSDEQGRFTIRGVARGAHVGLRTEDARFAPTVWGFNAGDGEVPAQVLSRRKPLDGQVVFEDGGRPVANAAVTVMCHGKDFESHYMGIVEARTDGQGRFRVYPYQGYVGLTVRVDVPGDASYELVPYWMGRTKQSVQRMAVPKGTTLRGAWWRRPAASRWLGRRCSGWGRIGRTWGRYGRERTPTGGSR